VLESREEQAAMLEREARLVNDNAYLRKFKEGHSEGLKKRTEQARECEEAV
jgi:hypothetical protein